MALDIGERRIGVAVSDPSGTLAATVSVIKRGSRREDFAAVAELMRRYAVEKVIVGHPRSLNGTIGPQGRRVERYAAALAKALKVPVLLWDERLSTVSAERLMREAGLGDEERRERVDAVAAAVILQDYLNAQQL